MRFLVIIIMLSLLFPAFGFGAPTAQLEPWQPDSPSTDGRTLLIGSVQCIEEENGDDTPFLAPASLGAFRIPDTDTRKAPRFDWKDADTAKYALWLFGHAGGFRKEMQLGNPLSIEHVNPGRYLIIPYLTFPYEIVESDKVNRIGKGFLLELESADYIGQISVNNGDVIYYGDILILKSDPILLGVINNIDNAKSVLSKKSPELAEKLIFRPFSGPFFKLVTEEQLKEVFDNYKKHSRQSILKDYVK